MLQPHHVYLDFEGPTLLHAEANAAEARGEAKVAAAGSPLPSEVQLIILHDPEAASPLQVPGSAPLQLDMEAGILEAPSVVSDLGAAALLLMRKLLCSLPPSSCPACHVWLFISVVW